MKKTIRFLLFLTFGVGNLLLIFSRIFSDHLNDFLLGFLEGISVVLIINGTIYLTRCAIKREHPLKTNK
ncbi:hypothetical protein [Prolixibacter denitrificans]|uniref:Uncharacterized protein n=1 Tax=Prolixibacter denitrificans TaxID=1541063 RepID=A0A2P8C6I5_9BACT|nr:hypothetical protein [Prolixibacter denitrificans]PSK80576.1 hypothetical protein CLV93_11413 [Prolixibacter denitrificans]GET22129.1 hypothetical protein JCM18694_23750 [Prolixibacter denitrificans]